MHCWARYLFVVVVVALGTLSMLGACGQKGPLVLPENAQQRPPAKATATPAEAPKPSTEPPVQSSAAPRPANQVQTPAGNLLAWPAGGN
ncbi:lipoprotein [uncultured Thiodictyon sp.]|uniref:LPS translocon maturation chaperone LptM n=1 Tax=uncultured Thiodictyon sp. TaxID=1846217 RepID=UPI0025F7A63A|nr:lipoprotein [uncultured Thiodictyon sp.]